MKRSVLFFAVLVLSQSPFLQAQEVTQEEYIHSMGVPSKYEFYWGPMFVVDQEQERSPQFGGQLYTGVYRNLRSPIFGLGINGEGYIQGVDGKALDGGVRGSVTLRPIFLQAGVDYLFGESQTDFLLSLSFPLKRGGLFGKGGNMRLDWLPGRNHTVNIGFSWPLGQPYMGKTRPKHDRVKLPKATSSLPGSQGFRPSPELKQTLEQLYHAADWINRYTTPFFDQNELDDEENMAGFLQKVHSFKEHLNLKDDLYPEGHSVEAEILTYHLLLERAFTLAVGGDQPSITQEEGGLRLADKAREILFHEVILPYNRLLGRNKKYDSLLGYGKDAVIHFTTWLDSSVQVSEAQRTIVLSVFTRLLNIMEEHRQGAKSIWAASELAWVPLQFGLQPHQYDTQKELDGILELMTEKQFSDANQIFYVIDEQFQAELARMILEAEDYHVLWIHDYRGVNAAGNPDSISFQQTMVYLAALTKRVREYDATGKLPVYLIVLDQYFFALTKGRFWIELLQNPLHHTLRFPPEYRDWAEQLEAAQEELRAAVAESTLLQEQTRKYGKGWLENRIKVHVNITNPSDYSFRSAHLIPDIPFAPDNLMRDHRKISFHDVTELDPAKGEALYGGMGVGEQYAGPTWEDRAILVRGPVLVALKNAARQVLLQQGFQEDEIPAPLRKQSFPLNYAEMIEALRNQGWTASVMDVHNQTGFRPKSINVLKATLYSLMPRGSTIIVPDGFWNTPFWGGMLAGAALRGCRVLVIAPARKSATFDAFALLSRTQELFSRLLMIHHELQDELDAVGGMLKTGIYARKSRLGEEPRMIDEFFEGIRANPFLTDIFPFVPDVYAVLEEVDLEMKSVNFQPTYYTEDAEKREPVLHTKLNFLFSDSVQHLMAWEGWDKVFRDYLYYRAKFVAHTEEYVDVQDIPTELRKAFLQTVRTYWESVSDEEQRRTMLYLTIGSQNHDYRGMIMDGEVVCVISGVHSLVALLDFFFLTGITTWVDDLDTLEELVPAYSGWRRKFARYIMKTL